MKEKWRDDEKEEGVKCFLRRSEIQIGGVKKFETPMATAFSARGDGPGKHHPEDLKLFGTTQLDLRYF